MRHRQLLAVLLALTGESMPAYDFVVGAGKAFDPARHFIVTTEMFGNGNSSSPGNTPGVVRLESAIRALTADPAFAPGRYTSPPKPGLAAVIDARIARDATRDANNLIAQARAWQLFPDRRREVREPVPEAGHVHADSVAVGPLGWRRRQPR